MKIINLSRVGIPPQKRFFPPKVCIQGYPQGFPKTSHQGWLLGSPREIPKAVPSNFPTKDPSSVPSSHLVVRL